MQKQQFKLTEDHLKLFRAAYTGWNDCEYGSPGIDCKYPYGDREVAKSIAKVLNWPPVWDESPEWEAMENRAAAIHQEMRTALQILMHFAGLAVQPGTYQTTEWPSDKSWEYLHE